MVQFGFVCFIFIRHFSENGLLLVLPVGHLEEIRKEGKSVKKKFPKEGYGPCPYCDPPGQTTSIQSQSGNECFPLKTTSAHVL